MQNFVRREKEHSLINKSVVTNFVNPEQYFETNFSSKTVSI